MKRMVMWMVAGAALLFGSGVATPLAAQCMACTSSSACGPSAARGGCMTNCIGEVCACSDARCRPGITAAPEGLESTIRLAASDGEHSAAGDAPALIVRDCDGTVELLVYSEDGTRLVESRLLLDAPDVQPVVRLARVEIRGD